MSKEAITADNVLDVIRLAEDCGEKLSEDTLNEAVPVLVQMVESLQNKLEDAERDANNAEARRDEAEDEIEDLQEQLRQAEDFRDEFFTRHADLLIRFAQGVADDEDRRSLRYILEAKGLNTFSKAALHLPLLV